MSGALTARFNGGPLHGQERLVESWERRIIVSRVSPTLVTVLPAETVDVEEGTYRMVTHTAFPRVFVWLGWKNSGLREAHHLLEDYPGRIPRA